MGSICFPPLEDWEKALFKEFFDFSSYDNLTQSGNLAPTETNTSIAGRRRRNTLPENYAFPEHHEVHARVTVPTLVRYPPVYHVREYEPNGTRQYPSPRIVDEPSEDEDVTDYTEVSDNHFDEQPVGFTAPISIDQYSSPRNVDEPSKDEDDADYYEASDKYFTEQLVGFTAPISDDYAENRLRTSAPNPPEQGYLENPQSQEIFNRAIDQTLGSNLQVKDKMADKELQSQQATPVTSTPAEQVSLVDEALPDQAVIPLANPLAARAKLEEIRRTIEALLDDKLAPYESPWVQRVFSKCELSGLSYLTPGSQIALDMRVQLAKAGIPIDSLGRPCFSDPNPEYTPKPTGFTLGPGGRSTMWGAPVIAEDRAMVSRSNLRCKSRLEFC